MTWTTSFSARTKARPEQIWKFWNDVSRWSEWDRDVASSRLDGPFREGTRGYLKPKGGPGTRFLLTSVEPPHAFTSRSYLPLCTLDFIHTLRVEDGHTVVDHRVELEGPLAFFFRRVVGAAIARGLPGAVERLVHMAEASE
jgi:hypothetical protein